MVLVLCFLVMLILGISIGDWITVWCCSIPFIAGALIFTINSANERKIQKRREIDPKFDAFMRDFERKYGR